MKIRYHILGWAAVLVALVLFFGKSLNGHIAAFYFASLLLPVVVSTTYFFNMFLVPRYLLKKRYFKFFLYLVYTLIISLYLEMLVITVSFVILANYRYENLSPIFYDVFLLAIIMYLIVFIYAFIVLVKRYSKHQKEISQLADEKGKFERGFINVRVNRRNQKVYHDEIVLIESLSDYVKITPTSENVLITKEKISAFEKMLPESFIRIHRSFIVNLDKVSNFNREEVMIGELTLPISRTYKKSAWEKLCGGSKT